MSEESQKHIKEFIANRLNELLTENKIKNQKALGQLTGHGEKLVYDLLRKKHNPSVVSIYDLCDYFGVTLEDFFRIDYDNDKSASAVMKLLSDTYTPEELSLLYDVFAHVDKEHMISMLSTYRDYHKSKREEENKKV